MIDLTIAIASCGRESLARTLSSLDQMRVPPDMNIEIVIADDDPNEAATERVAESGEHKLPVRCIPVGAQNISTARNACLDSARGTLLAFIDDDEWVSPGWLNLMLACREEFDATAVFGPVLPQYPTGTAGWLIRADPLYVEWGRRGTVVSTGRSGNALIDLEFVQRRGVRFDPALGRSGGEDTAFFADLHEKGGKLVVTDDAMVFETIPAERMTLDYFRTRSLRSGQSYARIVLGAQAGQLRRAVFALNAAAKMTVAFATAALMRPINRSTSLKFSIKGWMNLGKLRDVTGHEMVPMH